MERYMLRPENRNKDRGRNSRLNPAAPPSEPYVRVYRIRLSGWWFTSGRIDRLRHGL